MSAWIIPTEHEKREWSRFANAAYRCGNNEIGHRMSVAASVSRHYQMPLATFDALQRAYRQWLCFNVYRMPQVRHG